MSEEFSAGVKILLQRMETNPEEFYSNDTVRKVKASPKWHDIMHAVLMSKIEGHKLNEALYLEDAEVDALFEGFKKIRRKAFDDHVMSSVLAPEQSDEELSSATHQVIKNSQYGWTDPAQQIMSGIPALPIPLATGKK